jgi:hypothetical protein
MQFIALAISRAVDVFPTRPHAGHQKGVRQPVALDRVAERLHHRVLPDQLLEALRPVFAREHAIGLRLLRLRRLVEPEAEGVWRFGHCRAP